MSTNQEERVMNLKYHVYRYTNGCKWMDNLQEAADYFNSLPTDDKYAAIGLSEGSYAVDAVIKGEYAKGQPYKVSQDVRQSILFQENPEKIIHELEKLYKTVGVDERMSQESLSALRQLAHQIDDDLEEM